MATPKPKPKPFKGDTKKPAPYKGDTKKPAPYTGEAAKKKYQEEISPDGMAAANAAAKKALEERYPGMFIPGTRNTAGLNRGR
jgi:hypothetical protein